MPAGAVASALALVPAAASVLAAVGFPPSVAAASPVPAAQLSATASLPWRRVALRATSSTTI